MEERKTKYCPGCNRTKPTAEFYKHRNRADGLQSHCKDCLNEHRRERHRRHPTRRRAIRLKMRYGISLDDWERLFSSQGRVCAICGTKDSGAFWHTDHRHSDGAVRGILCAGCNLGLGVVERAGWLEAAQAYLDAKGQRLTTLTSP